MKRIILNLTILILTFICLSALGQKYSFSEIKETLFVERPQYGDSLIRRECLFSIQDQIINHFPPINPGIFNFYPSLVNKAIMEIEHENVTEGFTVWQIYNHGFVVKTPSVTFGFDLYNYNFHSTRFNHLANLLDLYLITHQHPDHFCPKLTQLMVNNNKWVITPDECNMPANIRMRADMTKTIAGVQITAHDGLHSKPVRIYEVTTPEGNKILHTGDNQTSETLPDVSDIDAMFLNCWVNESGGTTHQVGIRNSIAKIKPAVTLPGHLMELWHYKDAQSLSYPHYSFRETYEADDGTLASEYSVLAYGERYHYGESDDTIPPNNIRDLDYTIKEDTLILTWNKPETAPDNETASFYRIKKDSITDIYVSDTVAKIKLKAWHKYNFAVYAMDDCGNQSLSFEETGEIDFCLSEIPDNKDNIIKNGNFDCCFLDPWSTYNYTLDDVASSTVLSGGECTTTPEQLSETPELWHIQLIQELSQTQIDQLVEGATYVLSFDAFASEDNSGCDVYFGQNEDPWTSLLFEGLSIQKEKQTYIYEFTMSSIFQKMKLNFSIGAEMSAYTFDNISLVSQITDTDNDGIEDEKDNCPETSNPNQADNDKDQIGNMCDNCRNTHNSDQKDTNNNGIGDACEQVVFSRPVSTIEKLVVFPNPAKDQVTIQSLAHDPIREIEIHDITGRMIAKIENINSILYTYRSNSMLDGLFYLKISTAKNQYIRKVVFTH